VVTRQKEVFSSGHHRFEPTSASSSADGSRGDSAATAASLRRPGSSSRSPGEEEARPDRPCSAVAREGASAQARGEGGPAAGGGGEAARRAARSGDEADRARTASLPARVIAVTKRKEATEAEAADKHAIVDRFHEQQAAGEKVSWTKATVERAAKDAARLDEAAQKDGRFLDRLQEPPQPKPPKLKCSLCGCVCDAGALVRRCARCTAARDADPRWQPPRGAKPRRAPPAASPASSAPPTLALPALPPEVASPELALLARVLALPPARTWIHSDLSGAAPIQTLSSHAGASGASGIRWKWCRLQPAREVEVEHTT